MRASCTLLLFLFCYTLSWAQPSNDDCVNATQLNLNSPPSCPSTSPATNSYTYNNNNATPASPYPALTGCSVGGQLEAPAAEVWFTFTATGNQTIITVSGGLSTPNIALATGADCAFLAWVDCASADPGDGVVTLVANTLVGQTYFMLVSGGNLNDQGTFDLDFSSSNDCNPCLLGNNFIASPPPQNGTYSSGQTVNFCFTINQWDVTSTIEWFHAITFDMGPGWDQFSITPTAVPPSCGGDGFWGYYDSWVSCNTGLTFGPGFAYESSSGVGCGGTPLDGNPGNNWGDGTGGCANIPNGGPPITFCWSATVSDCPPNTTGNDLSVSASVWSDGDSGSWTQTGCNSGTSFDQLASAICCTDLDPLAIPTNTSCSGGNDGSIEIQPSGGVAPPGELYNIVVFDAMNNIIFTCDGCMGSTFVNNLPAGNYTINATNVLSGCSRSTLTVIQDGLPPMAIASTFGMPCPGDPISLMGDIVPFDPTATYFWTGPNNYTSTQQNPTDATEPGIYTLVVTVNGCQSDPATVDVQIVNLTVTAMADPNPVCFGEQVILTAQGALTYEWFDSGGNFLGAGNPFILNNVILTQTIMVEGTDVNGCTATADVLVEVIPLPFINVNITGDLCAGNPVVLQATGAVDYVWWDGVTDNPRIVEFMSGVFDISVQGTDANGCTGVYQQTIFVPDPPQGMVTPDNPTICEGESVTLTASGGNSYSWNTMDNVPSITVSPTVTSNYTVTVTDFDGCEDIVDVVVTVDPSVEAPNITCGNITPTSVEFIWDPVAGATGYDVVVITNQTGTLNGETFTVDNLSPGETVTIEVTPVTNSSCSDGATTFSCSAEDCPPVDVSITPVDDICLETGMPTVDLELMVTGGSGGTTSWSGDGVTDINAGIFDPNDAGIGTHEIIGTYTEGVCPYSDTIQINVYEIPTADFDIDLTEVCIDDPVTVTYQGSGGNGTIYTWGFDGGNANPGTDEGPHTVSWPAAGTYTISLTVEENGCTSEEVTQVINVLEPLPAPDISCGTATTTSVEFGWTDIPGADSYTVNVISGPDGTLTGSTVYTVDNLMPGETVTIEVIAVNSGPCGNSSAEFTCTAEDCPTVTIDIDPVADFCLDGTDQSVDLTATLGGVSGNGTLTWDGPGITDMMNGTFDPDNAGVGPHTITATYTDGPCEDSETIDITVYDTPTADFDVDPGTVCIDQEVTVTYDGSADVNNATFDWDFDGGTVVSGMDEGPYTITWGTAGTRTISLTVEENGCTSEEFTQDVTIEAPLPAPTINCNTTTSSIEFTWNDVNGATGYTVTVLDGPTGTQDGNSYLVENLNPGDEVTIEVEAIGDGPCGSSFAELSCIAEDCPMATVTFDPVDDICLDGTTTTITLVATVEGVNGGGTVTWSGPGIVDGAAGIFDPEDAGPGEHTINHNYQEGNCTYNNSLTINVYEQPTADFLADSPVCVDEIATITYDGSAGAGATYDWDFAGGTVISGMEEGPYEVSWSTAGPKEITLNVTENGCPSEEFSVTVMVEAPLADPVVNCATTNTSITFTWAEITGATGYEVVDVTGPAGTLDSTTYTVENLNPGDEVTIQVIAQTDSPCGPSMTEATCTATECPDVAIDIDPVMDLCEDDDPTTLVATAAGGAGGGTYTWTGDGITDPSGEFDPTMVNPGTITLSVNYAEGVCTYNASVDVTVFAVPTADFTVVSPICIDASSTITYEGTATDTAEYTWDFDGGTADPGTGQGPHEVSWTDPGMKTITLTVSENGCVSEEFTQTVQVDPSLPEPVVSCETTNTSILFTWPNVTGATSYEVEVVSGTSGTQNGNSYEVTGLNPGDEVTIIVTALSGNACPNSMVEVTCIAQDCPDVTIDITPVDPLCETGDPITLEAEATGGVGGGTFSWGGDGITDPSGIFDPETVPVGTHTITVVYTEGACDYSTTVDIEVLPNPVADFTFSADPVCIDEPVTITFTGSASADAIYTWNFGGGTADPGTGPGPHTVTWATAGAQTVTLMIEDNGCTAGEGIAQTITVEEPLTAPVIVCEETSSTSITFGWAPITGATGYEVVVQNGPDGVLDGTTYTIDGLTPQQEVTIEVTALGDGPCGNSSAEGTCIAQDCPPLTTSLSGTTELCTGGVAEIVVNFNTDSEGPFIVEYQLSDGSTNTIEISDGGIITLDDLQETTTIQILSVTDSSLDDCVYPGNVSWIVQVNETPTAGTPADPARLCEGEEEVIILTTLLEGNDPGGQWMESSENPSSGGAFNAANGTFTVDNQAPGTYSFVYMIDAGEPCPDASAEVTVTIEPTPVADAGDDQLLTCNMGMVSLGGTTDPNLTYTWTSDNPDAVINNPNEPLIDVSQPGTYTLTVSNDLGCTATDEAFVDVNLEVPTAEVSVTEISCFESNDGVLSIENVTGGTGPYTFSLNGSSPSAQMVYPGLGPDSYSLVITDQNGCFTELNVDLTQPEELVVTLSTNLEGDERVIELGDSVRLQAVMNSNIAIDTILWEPDSLGMGNSTSIWVSPTTTATYSVTVIDDNGCRDSDNMTLFVRKDRPVFIPNVFSPNEDGFNDVFFINGGDQVKEVKAFLIFNRWGESLMELYNFQPNDPSYGWDGTFRGQLMNTGVYVYYAEIEFDDGEVILYEGDVMLMK